MGAVPISVIYGYSYPLSPINTRAKSCFSNENLEKKPADKMWPSARGIEITPPPKIVII